MARKRKRRRAFGRVRQLQSRRWQAAYIGPDNKLHKRPRHLRQPTSPPKPG